MGIAIKRDLVIRIDARPGRFVTDRVALLSAVPPERVSDDTVAALRGAFVIGPDRTTAQDLEFSLRRIVEIAQRALSPGTNDPTTALYCIDRLEEALCRLAKREIPSPVRVDAQGGLRVLTSVNTFEDLACPAIAAVARYGTGDADVIRRLLEMIEELGRTAGPSARDGICALGDSIRRASRDRITAFDPSVMPARVLSEPGRTSNPPNSG